MTDNPFNPTPGALPSVFEGRADEIKTFQKMLRDLDKNKPTPATLVLYAPRGNGKTALLTYIKDHTEELCAEIGVKNQITTISATPPQCNMSNMYQTITGTDMPIERSKTNAISGGIRAFLKMESKSESTHICGSEATSYFEVFKRTSDTQRTLLCIDEAHTMNRDNLRDLLQGAQQCTQNHIPVSVVLAGTPGLVDVINSCGATFSQRYAEMTLKPLEDDSARRVFENPFRSNGMSVPEEYVQEALSESNNYPYVLQLYGSFAWEYCVEEGVFESRPSLWENVSTEFEKEKNRMYRGRYDELRDKDLTEAAYEIAKLYADEDQYLPEELTESLEKIGILDAKEVLKTMKELGYIWRPEPDNDFFECGIPSLMNYVIEREKLKLSRRESNQ